MSEPVFSVVMPVYNVEAYIGAAIRSVLRQSFADFELIIVDDGGQDRSLDICRSFDDPRIRIVSQANRGLAGARNTGIAHARGRYIALLDSDDLWREDKLMLHYIHLQASAWVDVSFAGSRLIDAEGAPMRVAMRPRLRDIGPEHILLRNPVGNGSAAVIRRAALDRVAFRTAEEPDRIFWFDENFRQSEDIEMWLRMAAGHGCRFEGIEGLLTDYRVIGGGLSANVVRQFETWSRAIDKAARHAPELIARYGARARAYQLRYLARRAVQLGDGGFALSLVGQALKAHPLMLAAEPRKTLTTGLASLAARWLPPRQFAALLSAGLGGRVA
jgi:glycosyltransferase involved in cell wall biosynthesis